MLELGNKKNGTHTYKKFFTSLGYSHISVDWNGEDGALKLDLRKPLDLGTFDMVSNIGTSEHVNGQKEVWENMVNACHTGSVLVSTTPMFGDWTWHGEWYPSREFYVELAEKNGFIVERLYLHGEAPRRMWFARLRRVASYEFDMPTAAIHFNRR